MANTTRRSGGPLRWNLTERELEYLVALEGLASLVRTATEERGIDDPVPGPLVHILVGALRSVERTKAAVDADREDAPEA